MVHSLKNVVRAVGTCFSLAMLVALPAQARKINVITATTDLAALTQEVAGSAMEVGRFVGAMPGLLTRAGRIAEQLDVATRDGLVLSPETIAAIGKAEARRNRWTAMALWVIAALLAGIGYMILVR